MLKYGTDSIYDAKYGERQIERAYHGESFVFEHCPYTRDGLILWLDGINNTGHGHDSNANSWIDLVGGTEWVQNYSPLRGGHWESNHFIYDSTDTEDASFHCSLIFPENFTVEVCFERFTNISQYNTVFTVKNDHISLYRGATESGIIFKLPDTRPSIANYKRTGCYISINRQSMVASIWTPYSSETIPQSSITKLDGIRQYHLGGIDAAHMFGGRIYGMRIYDRMLSETEMQSDWNADISRYGLDWEE